MVSDSPEVSVLLAVHNGETFLREAIESVVSQKSANFEVIVIDDGSVDASLEIANEYRGDRFRVLSNIENLGLAKSLNRAAQHARGQYLARQDADDLSAVDRLSAQLSLFKGDPNLALVGCWWEWIDQEGMTYSESRPEFDGREASEELFKGRVPCPHGSLIMRRDVFEELEGYDERFWYSQDFDLWLRFFKANQWKFGIAKGLFYRLRQMPIHSPFKELCQLRYTELALEQIRCGERIEFEEVRAWVARQYPEAASERVAATATYFDDLGRAALLSRKDRTLARQYFKRGLAERVAFSTLAGLLCTFLPVAVVRLAVKCYRRMNEKQGTAQRVGTQFGPNA